MTVPIQDNEKHLSQLPALHLLQQMKPSWQVLTKDEADRQRGGRLSNVFLDGILRDSLASINRVRVRGSMHSLSESAISELVERLKRPRPYGLIRVNEELTDLLLLGEAVEVQVDGQRRSPQLRYIDWEEPANNAYHAVAEFQVAREQPGAPCRVDIALFVNGIPFAVVECKSPSVGVRPAVDDLLFYQGDKEIPALFRTAQLLLAVSMQSALYGTVGTPKPFWSAWKEREDDEAAVARAINAPLRPEQRSATFSRGFSEDQASFDARTELGERTVTEQDRVLWALLRPERLLDMARRFTLFDAGVKKVARYQQFFTIRRILERVTTQRDADGRRLGGVVWHTQGSGKSLTMVMLARALGLERSISDARVVLVTDRVDLDEQLEGTFRACGLVPHRAGTGRHLLDLLDKDRRSIVTTVINKFETALNVRDFKVESDNVFVMVDEAHRGQYGAMFDRMRRVLPKACFLGFTGTPILKAEKNTSNRFGGIIPPTYTIRQAVSDKAVVPLLYEGRLVEQTVAAEAIDAWFDRVCAGLTEAQKADLKKAYARTAKLFQTAQTIRMIAFDVSEHFRRNFQGETPFKGQLVAPSKKAAIQYRDALREMGTVTAEVIISPPAERETDDDPESASALVENFWNEMMARFGNEATYNSRVIEAFRKREEPEILIVVSKLLTGFDAPRNAVLYLARPLREHTLLQAIARVNRVYEGKDYGYVVDYSAVLKDLNDALTSYDEAGLQGFDEADLADTVQPMRAVVAGLGQCNSELWDVFRGIRNTNDTQAMLDLLAGDEARRAAFYDRLNVFARTLGLAFASHEFTNDPTNRERVDRYRDELKRFENMRRALKLRCGEGIDYGRYRRQIEKLLDTYLIADQVRPIAEDLDIFDDVAVAQVLGADDTARSRADAIASATKKTITERMDEDPAFYKRFSQLIQQVIEEFRAKRISELEYLKKIQDIRDHVAHRRADDVPEGVRANPAARAFFGVIRDVLGPLVSAGTDSEAISADTARAALNIVETHRRIDWAGRADVENLIKNDLDDYAFDVLRGERGIPLEPEQIDALIDQLLVVARRLVP